ncbi:hypothetical protein PGT21_033202 [Puccinia graminis f. sp. tritici]|uniref:Uncharacterized protein n=1 Tax=Puccinia graminis f. sp. tritici TaxID=56615 RepID=A0A5B0M6H6_PUCGR|nr:hypothetical protein PGT21_033202 [Puccinia graminis f. sp. tritici]
MGLNSSKLSPINCNRRSSEECVNHHLRIGHEWREFHQNECRMALILTRSHVEQVRPSPSTQVIDKFPSDNMLRILENRGNYSSDRTNEHELSSSPSNTQDPTRKRETRLDLTTIVELIRRHHIQQGSIDPSFSNFDQEDLEKLSKNIDPDTYQYLIRHFHPIDNVKLVKNPIQTNVMNLSKCLDLTFLNEHKSDFTIPELIKLAQSTLYIYPAFYTDDVAADLNLIDTVDDSDSILVPGLWSILRG